MHSTLELLLKRLVDINRENAAAAQRALYNVNKSLESFKDNLSGPKTYTRQQVRSGNDKSGHLVSRKA